MPTNDFLPFAAAGGANVLSQAAYAAEAARLAGVTAGIGRSDLANKSWRQSASIAAMLGQFIVDYGALDALDDGNITNLLLAYARTLQIGKVQYARTFGGTANALVAVMTPAPASYVAGMVISGILSAPNTGATTINVSSLGVKNIVNNETGAALAGGEFKVGKIVELEYDGTSFRLLSPLFTSFINGGTFGPSGSLGPTGTTSWLVPVGVTRVKVRCWGGGGGGGGSQAFPSAGAGGGGGGYAEGVYPVTPGTSISVTAGAAGAGGAGGAGNNGTNGGASSFGAFCTAGAGGLGGGAATGGYQTGFGAGGTPAGGNFLNIQATPGSPGSNTGVPSGMGGAGGAAYAGAGGAPTFGAGNQGAGPGGGGSGGANGAGGGSGSPGIVIVEW